MVNIIKIISKYFYGHQIISQIYSIKEDKIYSGPMAKIKNTLTSSNSGLAISIYSLSNPSTITPPIDAGKPSIIILFKAIIGSSKIGILLSANSTTKTITSAIP
jgi:hypothetical protein